MSRSRTVATGSGITRATPFPGGQRAQQGHLTGATRLPLAVIPAATTSRESTNYARGAPRKVH
ncbi:hypothetical protein ACFQ1S_26085, partial [Kibdelosporangium lantanae]